MTMVTTVSTEQKSIVVAILNFVSRMPNPLVVLTPELIPTHPEWESLTNGIVSQPRMCKSWK